jgi:hypothetical protein
VLTFSFSASITPSENITHLSLSSTEPIIQEQCHINTVTRLKAGWCRVQIMARTRNFSFRYHPDRLWRPTQAPVQQTLGAPSPGLKQPDHEIGYFIPSSVRLRSGTTPPLPLYTLLHDSVYLCYLAYCCRCQHFPQDVQFEELQMNTLTTVNL